MSIRDRLPKKTIPQSSKSTEPQWVTEGSDTVKSLYRTTLQEHKRIVDLIKKGDVSSPKDRKLILANITKLAGRDRSTLQPRRQPELYDWISRLNDELDKLSELHESKPRKTVLKSKRQLEHENAALRKELREMTETGMREIVEEFFNSNLLDDRDKMAREISRLRLENSTLIDKVTVLQRSNKQLSRENAFLHAIKK